MRELWMGLHMHKRDQSHKSTLKPNRGSHLIRSFLPIIKVAVIESDGSFQRAVQQTFLRIVSSAQTTFILANASIRSLDVHCNYSCYHL